jgi:hypothetical protein
MSNQLTTTVVNSNGATSSQNLNISAIYNILVSTGVINGTTYNSVISYNYGGAAPELYYSTDTQSQMLAKLPSSLFFVGSVLGTEGLTAPVPNTQTWIYNTSYQGNLVTNTTISGANSLYTFSYGGSSQKSVYLAQTVASIQAALASGGGNWVTNQYVVSALTGMGSGANETPFDYVITGGLPADASLYTVEVIASTAILGAASAAKVLSVIAGDASADNTIFASQNISTLGQRAQVSSGGAVAGVPPFVANIYPISGSATNIHIQFTPNANWNTLTAGQVTINVTYLNSAAA